jgi:hypothetical protein
VPISGSRGGSLLLSAAVSAVETPGAAHPRGTGFAKHSVRTISIPQCIDCDLEGRQVLAAIGIIEEIAVEQWGPVIEDLHQQA